MRRERELARSRRAEKGEKPQQNSGIGYDAAGVYADRHDFYKRKIERRDGNNGNGNGKSKGNCIRIRIRIRIRVDIDIEKKVTAAKNDDDDDDDDRETKKIN